MIVLLFFFYIYLPATTNHNETITVPDLVGKSFANIDEFLTNRNLQYVVTADSGFSEDYQPEVILSQNPKGGAKVKEDRKIYLTLNANVPPQIRMPNLINTDKLNADDNDPMCGASLIFFLGDPRSSCPFCPCSCWFFNNTSVSDVVVVACLDKEKLASVDIG